jgi:hypothetical protein
METIEKLCSSNEKNEIANIKQKFKQLFTSNILYKTGTLKRKEAEK